MSKFVALLRGINVGGKHIIRMAELRALCEELGFTSVATYVQSGNIVFDTATRKEATVSEALEEAIRNRFGFDVAVMTRTASEIAVVAERNPFLREAKSDPTRVYVSFLPSRPTAARVRGIKSPATNGERFQVIGREIYLHYPNGYGRSKLTNVFFERALGIPSTARNARTVEALHRLTNTD